MFNISGTMYTRDGERNIEIISLSFEEMRRELVSLIVCDQVDDVKAKRAIPGAYSFPQEESDLYVVPTTDEAKAQLKAFAQAVKQNDCTFFNVADGDGDIIAIEDLTWADGSPFSQEDYDYNLV